MEERELRQQAYEAWEKEIPKSLSMEQLYGLSVTANPAEMHNGLHSEKFFENMTATADAFKDVLQWLRAQSMFIQETYKDDKYRRQLHMAILNEGFKALLKGGRQ